MNRLNNYSINSHNNASISRLTRQGHWWGSSAKQRRYKRGFKDTFVQEGSLPRRFDSSSPYDSMYVPVAYRGKNRDPRDLW